MTVEEIFKNLNIHIIKGIMLHDQMADYFDFLNMHGYKRLHEYRYLEESAEMRGLHRYYINHYNKLLPEAAIENPKAIPSNWYAYERINVNSSEKRSFVMQAFEKWYNWERETKELYQKSYSHLCEIGEISAACKVKDMLMKVDKELKEACRMKLSLKMVDYDLPTIYLFQDELHEHYKNKEKEIGIDIC